MKEDLKNRLIVALDVDNKKRVQELVSELKGMVGAFKVGKQLFTALGPDIVQWIHEQGERVFLDLKFHDIPRTVALACQSVSRMGVFMLTIHATGSEKMMREAVVGLSGMDSKPLLFGVTILTSFSEESLDKLWGSRYSLQEQVLRLAKMSQDSGLDGVVCSPHEIDLIKKECGPNFYVVTPGVRFVQESHGDQVRVMDPCEALRRGADFIVMGRSVVESSSPRSVIQDILRKYGDAS